MMVKNEFTDIPHIKLDLHSIIWIFAGCVVSRSDIISQLHYQLICLPIFCRNSENMILGFVGDLQPELTSDYGLWSKSLQQLVGGVCLKDLEGAFFMGYE